MKEIALAYMNTSKWKALAPRSREIYRAALKHIDNFMEMDASDIKRADIIAWKDSHWDSPGKCKTGLAILSNLLSYAYDNGIIEYNHALRVPKLPPSKAIPRWTDAECKLFMEKAPAHLRRAFALALYTGQRRSDLVRMKMEQYDGQFIKVQQMKTKKELLIPVHPSLKIIIDQTPRKKATEKSYVIFNSHGDPWSTGSLTSAIGKTARKLGIKGRSIHGLRKTTAAMLAEMGCTTKQIMAITGHASYKEIQRYTDEAEQKQLAQEAIRRWSDA